MLRRRSPLFLATALSLGLFVGGLAEAGQPRVEDRRAIERSEIPKRIGRDRVDVEATAKIRAFTTDDAYSTEWVDYLPDARGVDAPHQFLGHVIGEPGILTKPEDIHAYFRRLAKQSRNVTTWNLGKSHGGREMIAVAVGSPKNLRKLEAIKKANAELADPRLTDEERARTLARKTPPIYLITAGLHSPETGPPEMVMELGYRLAVSDQPHIKEIRKNVVTVFIPVLEVDGRARVVDWVNRHLKDVKDLDDAPPRMGPYWGDYTAHDNNRDGLQLSQPLTRNYTRAYHDLKPVLSLDLHESVPLLYVSTGTGPYNEAVDPITVTQWQWISSFEVSQATKLGLPGVWTWGFYTGWYPGYLLWVTNNHNATGRFYETFGNGHPGTFRRDLRHSEFAGDRTNARTWYRSIPPDKEVVWSLRDNTNYMQTGVISSLLLAARHGEDLLLDYWRKNRNGIENGKAKPPHALVIPHDADPFALHGLLELLEGHQIEVHRATKDAESKDGVKLRKGDYLVKMDQPYRNFAKTLLTPQPFPKQAKHTPYDDVAWSLDLMLGVDVEPTADPEALGWAAERVEQLPPLGGALEGDGARVIVPHRGQANLASLAWQLTGKAQIRALAEPWQDHPAGSLVVEGASREDLVSALAALHLDAVATDGTPPSLVEVNLPRVAVFHTWRYTQDSGWLRYTLEWLGIPFTLIDKDDLREGKLGERYDVIVVPSQGGMRFADIVHGIDTKHGPLEYTKTDEFPSHGVIDSSPDITGGMGFEGLTHLHAFVREGGVLVGLGSGTRLATEGGLTRRVRDAPSGRSPGSHITAKILRPEHPIAWGYPGVGHVFRGNHPNLGIRERDRGYVVAQYGTTTFDEADKKRDERTGVQVPAESVTEAPPAEKDDDAKTDDDAKKASKKPPLVLSGIVKDSDVLERAPAIVDVPVAKGRALLYSFNPAHRHQNRRDFAWLTNALLFFDDMPATPTEAQMREREAPPEPELERPE